MLGSAGLWIEEKDSGVILYQKGVRLGLAVHAIDSKLTALGKDALQGAYDHRTVVVLPVYDGVRDNGQNTTYHIYGYAGFVVTGYQLPGFSASMKSLFS